MWWFTSRYFFWLCALIKSKIQHNRCKTLLIFYFLRTAKYAACVFSALPFWLVRSKASLLPNRSSWSWCLLRLFTCKTTLLINTNLCQAWHRIDWHVLIHFHPPIIFISPRFIMKSARPGLCYIVVVGVLDDHNLVLMYNICAIMEVYVVEYEACLQTESS